MLFSGLPFFVFIGFTQAAWYNDIISPNGWRFGDGMVFHIEDTKDTNSSFLDRIALRVNYGNVEVCAIQKPEKEAVQLDFLMKDKQEGRNKKTMGNMLIPFWLGAAKGTAVTTLLAGMKIIALKSLLLAKLAFIISAAIIASKYLKKSEPYYVEVEQGASSQQMPVYEYPGVSNIAEHQTAYAPYHAYAPSAVAESTGNYATVVDPAAENGTVPAKQYYAPAVKRKDQLKRKIAPVSTVLTIKQYNRHNSLI